MRRANGTVVLLSSQVLHLHMPSGYQHLEPRGMTFKLAG